MFMIKYTKFRFHIIFDFDDQLSSRFIMVVIVTDNSRLGLKSLLSIDDLSDLKNC